MCFRIQVILNSNYYHCSELFSITLLTFVCFSANGGGRFNRYIMVTVTEWDQRYQDRAARSAEIQAQRVRDIRAKTDDDL